MSRSTVFFLPGAAWNIPWTFVETIKRLLRNRNFLLVTALFVGLLRHDAAQWSEPLVFPALALIMTLAVMDTLETAHLSVRMLLSYGTIGILMNYAVHGSLLIGLSYLLIGDQALRAGFIILAAMPPAVAVVPFSAFLRGNSVATLMGTIGSYLGALALAPLVAFTFLGDHFVSPVRILRVIGELIAMPVILAWILAHTPLSKRVHRYRGTVTNWSFFLITYTIVGVNRHVFIEEPMSLLPLASIAFAGTFVLGWLIETFAKRARLARDMTVSMVLLGTLKNYGLSGGITLSFLDPRTAVPSAVSVIFMILYILWLEYRQKSEANAPPAPSLLHPDTRSLQNTERHSL